MNSLPFHFVRAYNCVCHVPRFETISDLMNLQDDIDHFQKRIFASLDVRHHNECRIAALVPLVEESYGIYKFVTSMLRAMHGSKSHR